MRQEPLDISPRVSSDDRRTRRARTAALRRLLRRQRRRLRAGLGGALVLGLGLAGTSGARALPLEGPADPRSIEAPIARAAGELLVIDARVPEAERLLAGLARPMPVLLLDPRRDGVSQIVEALERGGPVSRVHVVAHGAPGQVLLGATVLDAASAVERREALRAAFSRGASGDAPDLLLWACDAARGAAGARFVAALHEATGADVAASADRTGGAVAGGDFELEVALGVVDRRAPFREDALVAYPHALDVIPVWNTNASGPGSLRWAVELANCHPGADTIVFNASAADDGLDGMACGPDGGSVGSVGYPDGTGPVTDASVSGTIELAGSALTLEESVVIDGPGRDLLTIDASGISDYAVFAASEKTIAVTISGLEIADAPMRAIYAFLASFVLEDSAITGSGNQAIQAYGSKYGEGVVLRRTTIEGTGPSSWPTVEGMISNFEIIDSTISGNETNGSAAAISFFGGDAHIEGSTLTGNVASAGLVRLTASVFEDADEDQLVVRNSTLSGNEVGTVGAITAAYGGDVFVSSSTLTGNETASGELGAALEIRDALSFASVESSILAGNGSAAGDAGAATPSDVVVGPGTFVASRSILGVVDGVVIDRGGNQLGVDPGLGPLADNGGVTQTHALLTGSPAIDRGSNPVSLTGVRDDAGALDLDAGVDVGALAYDQRGAPFVRVYGARADVGAFEVQPPGGAGGGTGGGVGGGSGGGAGGGSGAGGGGGGTSDSGCGCAVAGASTEGGAAPAGLFASLAGLAAIFGRRRSRRRDRPA